MNSWNLIVKGYINDEDGCDPIVTLSIASMLTMDEIKDILAPIRASFNNSGDTMTFDISFRDMDV